MEASLHVCSRHRGSNRDLRSHPNDRFECLLSGQAILLHGSVEQLFRCGHRGVVKDCSRQHTSDSESVKG